MADGAASAEPEGAGVIGAALAAGAGATVGVAEATGDAAGRAAATTGFFFFAIGFFGGVTACRVT